jgi:cobaltochelatase CobS
MATQNWESIKEKLESLSHRKLVMVGRELAKALDKPLGDYQKGGKTALLNTVKRFAYEHAEAGFQAHGRDGAYAHTFVHILATLDASTEESGEEAQEATSVSATGDDAAKLAELIARMAGSRANVSPEMVRAIVKEEIKSLPALTIELKRDGEVFAKVEGRQHAKFPSLLKACSARTADGFAPNVWISGPAGSGKTRACMEVAKALGLEFHYNGALTMAHELMGFRDAAGNYHDTPFRKAFTAASVYLFDEVDGSDNGALLPLNAALANGHAAFPDGSHERHKDSRIIAAANTWGLGATADYVGRAKLDAAFLNRFPVKVHFDYDLELEAAISGNPDYAREVQAARAAAHRAGLKVVISPRDTMAGAALIAAGFSKAEAKELTYLASLTADQRRMIEGA